MSMENFSSSKAAKLLGIKDLSLITTEEPLFNLSFIDYLCNPWQSELFMQVSSIPIVIVSILHV